MGLGVSEGVVWKEGGGEPWMQVSGPYSQGFVVVVGAERVLAMKIARMGRRESIVSFVVVGEAVERME